MQQAQFDGFSTQAINFLQEWRHNNNRDWFQPRKSEYEQLIKQPALDFIVELGNRLKLVSPEIQFDLRHNGSLLRIYRDTRFSMDKTPYHPNVRTVFWQGAGKKTDNPGFFVRIDDSGAGVFVGKHGFTKPQLLAFRQAVDDDKRGTELEEILESVKQSGDYTIGEKTYKRTPREFDADHERADLLKFGGLYAMFRDIPKEALTSPDFVDICFEHCHKMSPVQQWLVRVFQNVS